MGLPVVKIVKRFFKMMKQRPDLCILCFSILVALFRFWIGLGTTSYVQPAKPPKPIFNKTSFVYDVYTGDLEDRDYILQFSEVSFVFYYAPWCHKSMLAAKEFAQIAKDMYHQITFAAVNCWWKQGECRRTTKHLTFPLLYMYHKSKKGSIQYNGPHLYKYYSEFLEKALNPVVYLGTRDSAKDFISGSQMSIIFYCAHHKSSAFKTYVEIALSALEKYPEIPLRFGLVLSKTLSSELGLKRNVLYFYDSTRSKNFPTSQLEFVRNITLQSVSKWVFNCSSLISKRIVTKDRKSNELHKVLKKGSALITFIRKAEDLGTVENIAIRYGKRKEQFHCCKTFNYPKLYSVCLKNSLSIDSSPSCGLFDVLLKRVWSSRKSTFTLRSESCIEMGSLYDVDRNRLQICSLPSNLNKRRNLLTIDGLAYETNMTLRFVSFDYDVTPQFAHALGFVDSHMTLPFTVILNVQNEEKYVMKQNFSISNLEQFILNYSNHLLTPTFSNPVSKENSGIYSSDLTLPSLLPQHFETTVLSSKKDVLVYYHAAWCGGCLECSHSLLELKMRMENCSNFLIYQVKEEANDQLPLAFKALSYPSIIFYPGKRTSDSVLFTSSCSYVNFIEFLLRNASTSTKAEILLRLCKPDERTKSSNYSQYAICKQHEILKRLAK